MSTTCCEHNRCPDRPKWFLARFQHRPWRCDQCGRFWVTEWTWSISSDVTVVLTWKEVSPDIRKDVNDSKLTPTSEDSSR